MLMTRRWFSSFLLFAWVDRKSLVPFALGIGIVAAAFFSTNWIAHQSLIPPYAHRGNGATIAEWESRKASPDSDVLEKAVEALRADGVNVDEGSYAVEDSDEEERWIVRVDERQFALLKNEADVWSGKDMPSRNTTA